MTSDINFLGIADETKLKGIEKYIIVLSKGVYPFNKQKETINIGEKLMACQNNELTLFTKTNKNIVYKKPIAIAHKKASENSPVVFAKIITNY